MTAAAPQRLTVCAVGGQRLPWELPSSVVDDGRDTISGGERSLYELACGASLLGHTVELRGHIDRAIFETISAAAGATPLVGMAARRPFDTEIVVLPESADLDLIAAVHLSGARGVIALLGPPGYYGWSFQPGWVHPDPLTVTPSAVGLASTYRAIEALGFDMWGQSHGIVDAGRAAGTRVTYLGDGHPVPAPPPVPKEHDLAVVVDNRWYPLAEQVVAELPDAVSVLEIRLRPSRIGLHEDLSPARLLALPTRVEGASRIAREARMVGTVPVTLGSNPFSTPEDWGEGVVVVDELSQICGAVTTLLADPDRLEKLAVAAAADARRQVDWGRFVQRLASAIEGIGRRPDGPARSALGTHLLERWGPWGHRP